MKYKLFHDFYQMKAEELLFLIINIHTACFEGSGQALVILLQGKYETMKHIIE